MTMAEKGTCTSFVSPRELQLNYFNEAVMKYFFKISFKDFES